MERIKNIITFRASGRIEKAQGEYKNYYNNYEDASSKIKKNTMNLKFYYLKWLIESICSKNSSKLDFIFSTSVKDKISSNNVEKIQR